VSDGDRQHLEADVTDALAVARATSPGRTPAPAVV